jgi:5'-nucleotidase
MASTTFAPARNGVARMLLVLTLLAGTLLVTATPIAAGTPGPGSARGLAARTVDVQLLAINDFHGNIEPPSGSSARVLTPAGPVEGNGGVEYLATHIRSLEATNPNTLTVAAGDLIGASPLISGYFHDEPTIEAMNALGLDISSVGNHEFDEGYAELLRMQNGGCHPVDGCQDGDGFAGADFQYLSANVVYAGTDETVFPAYTVREFKGAKIAFVGMTLEGTPAIVTPVGSAGLEFRDEAETVNALVPELQAQGIQSIVVLLHEGLVQTPSSQAFLNTCNGASGPLIDIVSNLDPAIDMVISGHTHAQYNCALPNSAGDPVAVSSAASFGRVLTEVDMKIDRATKDIYQIAVNNHIVTRDVAKDATETAIIAKSAAAVADVRNAVVGSITEDLLKAQVVDESTLGNLIADSQLEGTTSLGAQFAVMNPGGIRADILCEAGEASPCEVTFGEVFATQPFQNDLVTLTLSGAAIDDLLEQQFAVNIFLSVSSNLHYQYDPAGALGSKVPDTSITLNGTAIDPAATYRVTGNAFLVSGTGDGFTVFAQATNRTIGMVDSQALVNYFGAHSPIAPPALDRVNPLP